MYTIQYFSKSLDAVLTEGSEDFNLIVETYNILTSNAPITNNDAQRRVGVLDSLRTQLVALNFMVSAKLNRLNKEYNATYYPLYQRWTIAGTKRSHAEIEAQIFKDNASLIATKSMIDDYYNVSSFIQSMIKSLDQARITAMEVWKNRY